METALAAAAGFALAGVVYGYVWLFRRSLPRNGFLGFCTKATTRSDAAWRKGHEAASGWTAAATAICWSEVLLTVGMARSDELMSVAGAVIWIWLALLIGCLLRANAVADRAAKSISV
ncbi:SdpI family protein [Blastococcus sp. Marseille-P5729]|uniref:SdpI family protein n=1 Tax=Blastococcus sp. Marseille-P5729 TaxID=2086582 RepID=UPI000D10EF2E|nr:SdpI family protein [Blastococcus sp. Marseille-P5729]